MKNNDTLYFRVKRLERLITVILGRLGVWKATYYILNILEQGLNRKG